MEIFINVCPSTIATLSTSPSTFKGGKPITWPGDFFEVTGLMWHHIIWYKTSEESFLFVSCSHVSVFWVDYNLLMHNDQEPSHGLIRRFKFCDFRINVQELVLHVWGRWRATGFHVLRLLLIVTVSNFYEYAILGLSLNVGSCSMQALSVSLSKVVSCCCL